jgi:hypothetical protein
MYVSIENTSMENPLRHIKTRVHPLIFYASVVVDILNKMFENEARNRFC